MKSPRVVQILKINLMLTAAWLAFALMSSAHFFLAENGVAGEASFKELFRTLLVFYWAWALLTPFVISVAKKHAVSEGVSLRSISILIASAAAVTLAHGVLYLILTGMFGLQHLKGLSVTGIMSYLTRHGGGDLATFAVIVGIVFLVEERRQSAERVVANAALQTRLAKADLELLRWQLHPHFLFNALNTVSTLVLQQKTERAERAISLIAEYLRAALDQRPETTVRLSDELVRVERYIEIERMRFGDSIRFQRNASETALNARIPSELVQPLIENAIVHGAVRVGGAEAIVLSAENENGRLLLSVTNPVSSENRAQETGNEKGFGLRYVRERLNQFYGDAGHFKFDVNGSCAIASLDIPYTTEARASA